MVERYGTIKRREHALWFLAGFSSSQDTLESLAEDFPDSEYRIMWKSHVRILDGSMLDNKYVCWIRLPEQSAEEVTTPEVSF